ncbi:glycoside hydrolase family 3 protein [Xylogone sp. PMI_703]|nr:glycoside hydrolase family 3 protein [Xylogone sp. PMI_703]
MRLSRISITSLLLFRAGWAAPDGILPRSDVSLDNKDAFLDHLLPQLTVPELALQLALIFGGTITGPKADNSLYDDVFHLAPEAGIGVIHDWYPFNKSQYNALQSLHLQKSRLKIPFMQYGECLHGVGSMKQSMFPQNIAMGASFDTDLVHRVGRALGTEARSLGIHACLSPVLDLGKEPRWGRVQENFGEDYVLTSHMGVAYASGLSKNGSWSDTDAIAPHFAAHGSPRGGINAAAFMGRGLREVLTEMLVPFKAAVDLGGVRGVMTAYSELDEIPCSVHPFLYEQLADWGYNGFVTSDDGAIAELITGHNVATSPADALQQWFNAGGGVSYYDFPLDVFLNATIDLVNNGTVKKSTLQSHVRRILDLKYDLGLFHNPFIPEDIDPQALTISHTPLTLEAAHKSIVLLENRNATLPINPSKQNISTIAVIGPFSDILNFGDYSGMSGTAPSANASTIREGIVEQIKSKCSNVKVLSAWGTNTWQYNGQYPIPGYHLSVNGSAGGLKATYFADTEFKEPVFQAVEVPNRDWGLYPPYNLLPSNNFSVIWEGELDVPVTSEVEGWIGVAVGGNTTAKLYIDGQLVAQSNSTPSGIMQPTIEGYTYIVSNSSSPPLGAFDFTFKPSSKHQIRIEYQAWVYAVRSLSTGTINSQVQMFWNLVDRKKAISQAVSAARDADLVVLALGAGWNSDGESGDRATLDLSPEQETLANAVLDVGKPVVLVLEEGRPFAIPDIYARSAAVVNAFFPGQSGGKAIGDVLFGDFNPGARLPVSVPYSSSALPSYYNEKNVGAQYLDIPRLPQYPFGYGLSYTTFSHELQGVRSTSGGSRKFSAGDTITFTVSVTNNGTVAGSHVPQIYLLNRSGSSVTTPIKQLVAFSRVYLDPGESTTVELQLEVDRYLPIINRKYKRELEKGEYVFALLNDASRDASTSMSVTLPCLSSHVY